MTEHRFKLARERAGLSLGQAAKLLGIERHALEQIEARPIADREDQAEQLAELYMVNVPWLTGAAPLRDYEAMKSARGYDKLTEHDRDTVAEFAASLPRGRGTFADRVHRLKGQGRR